MLAGLAIGIGVPLGKVLKLSGMFLLMLALSVTLNVVLWKEGARRDDMTNSCGYASATKAPGGGDTAAARLTFPVK